MSGNDNTSHTFRTLVGQSQQQSLLPTDSIIYWFSGGFAIYTLPPAASFPGRMVTFIATQAGSCQVFAPTGDTADGSPSTLSWNVGGGNVHGTMTIVSDGANGWWTTNSANTTRI